MEKKEAEILINGPRRFSGCTVPVKLDGTIAPYQAKAALTVALQGYNNLLDPREKEQHGNTEEDR